MTLIRSDSNRQENQQKVLAFLQPVLIPDLCDLALMYQADKIILHESERWSRKGRTHRARIRTPDGTDYLSIPILKSDRKKPICEVRIDQSRDWFTPLWRTLEFNYRNSIYFEFYEPEIHADFSEGLHFEYLIDFSAHLRKRLFRYLEISLQADICLTSQMEEYTSEPDLLASRLHAEVYYQEHNSRHYMRQGNEREWPDFTHPVYRQHFEGFEPFCCLYDLLFQYGPESFQILDRLRIDNG